MHLGLFAFKYEQLALLFYIKKIIEEGKRVLYKLNL